MNDNIHLAYDSEWESICKDFKMLSDSGATPSESLRKVIAKHDNYIINQDVTLSLLMSTYDIMPQGVIDWLHENQYPNRVDLLSDAEFDKKIDELIKESQSH